MSVSNTVLVMLQDLSPRKTGTFGGLFFLLLVQFEPGELTKTFVLAAIGAAVSFFVSLFLKQLVKWIERRTKGRSK